MDDTLMIADDTGTTLSHPCLDVCSDNYPTLIERHQAMLMSYVRGIVGDVWLAEDVCQDTFLQGHMQFERLKDKVAFPYWLRTIARRTAYVEISKRNKELPTDPHILKDAAVLNDGSSSSVNEHFIELIQQCVCCLPKTLRTCFQLHYYEGLSRAEIALRFGMEYETVRKRLERARKQISRVVLQKLARK